jgi:hypothetical protein
MAIKIYIFGEASLWSRAGGQLELENDLQIFLGNRGRVTLDGEVPSGPQWNVDLLLYADTEDVESWILRLTTFMRQWGVLDRTLHFTIVRESDTSTWEHRRVKVDSV